jgi:hypothetical protein
MELPGDDDLVYVPARPAPAGEGQAPAVELRRLRDTGEPVGLAFTSLDALVATLGDCQPWISMPMHAYVTWLRMQKVGRVQIDPEYHDDVREWTAATLTRAVEEG